MKKILFTIASCITGTAIFIACSNEETFETVENYSAAQQSHKKQLKTRGCTMTIEEVEDIFNRLNEKYNTNWFLPKNPNLAGYTEDFFLYLENLTRKDLGLELLNECSVKGVTTYSLWDDSVLDEIAVASTSKAMVESNVVELEINAKIYNKLIISDIKQNYYNTKGDTVIFNNHKIDLTFHQTGKLNSINLERVVTKLIDGPNDITTYPQELEEREIDIVEVEITPEHIGVPNEDGYLFFYYNLVILADNYKYTFVCDSDESVRGIGKEEIIE